MFDDFTVLYTMDKMCKKKCLNFKILDKTGLGEYPTINFRHIQLSCNIFLMEQQFFRQ